MFNSCVDCYELLNYVLIIMNFFLDFLVVFISKLRFVGSSIWMNCLLSLMYIIIGKMQIC